MTQVLRERAPHNASPMARLQTLLERLEGNESVVSVEGLHGASRALFLAQLLNATGAAHSMRPLLIVVRDQITGESLLGDLQYFLQREKLKETPRFFPAWELLPYERLSPLSEISGERLEILDRLANGSCPLLIAPVEALMQYVLPRSVLKKLTYLVRKGDSVEREFLHACLVDNGYSRNSLVEERGEFSLRGDILDIFPPAGLNPARVEFFGDEVESIRVFDVNSQVSLQEVSELKILPAREICLSQSEKERGIENIVARAKEDGIDRVYWQDLEERIRCLGGFSGIETLAPFFYPEMETVFDYLPENALIALDEEELVRAKCAEYRGLVQVEYRRALERRDVVPPPEDFYLGPEEFSGRLRGKHRISLGALRLSEDGERNAVQYQVKPCPSVRGQFEVFAEHVSRWKEEGYRVVVVAPAKGQARRVHELLQSFDLGVDVDLGLISAGFQFPDLKKAFVAEHEIFGKTHKHRHRRRPKSMSFQRGFKDLKPGDFLVHIDYGIGRYAGTRELQTGVGGGEFMEILYADDEKLYIPMDGLAHIQKYVGSAETPPPLSKLGAVTWKRQRDKVKESIREMAEGLLKLYAARELAETKGCVGDPALMREFSDSFEYEETEDQMKAIEEVCADLESPKPMDRLVCGDVGYGKTEVAMRAAFKAVLEKRQAAVLVPTTILAQQHLNTFRERFRAYPANIEMVNRFRSPREQKDILARLRNGEVDIIIGTHRLLSQDVKFANLGLIIIDEEQRFGVKHKEKLKQLRATVDILTLSATPIPRTLHFSLMGIRDLSVIETPPNDRLAIKTFVRKFDDNIVREAILRELDRGGQIYFVHNKVKSIHSVAEMLKKIVPHARIGIAHGQLHEHALERVMRQFIDKEIDLLLCTSIIESGLDIPSANTIVINRADQFGLAQLYQLRGRVGRYKHQAYAYLLIPGVMAVSEEARKRLTAIEEMSELGAGFQLAARDMEIRGTGNMLGHNQSGHINTIGFDLYCKLIEDTVKEMRGEKIESRIEPEVDVQIKGFIPKDYIPDLNQRLEVYRRLLLVGDLEALRNLEEELADRYGALPEPAQKLAALLRIKVLCQKLRVSKAILRVDTVYLNIEPTTPMSSGKAAGCLDKRLRFASEYRMTLVLDRKGWKQDVEMLTSYLEKLAEACDERAKN
ncbi:MAG: transcription-repair coupling factor [Nitrospinae bacterium]|nr:transcription-repair coupling factor [Nitrospinota bacterium]